MFKYFSNSNLSLKNGDSATISMGNWFVLYLINLLSIIPIVGTILVFVLYIILAFRRDVAPSVANYLKATLIVSVIALVIFLVSTVILYMKRLSVLP